MLLPAGGHQHGPVLALSGAPQDHTARLDAQGVAHLVRTRRQQHGASAPFVVRRSGRHPVDGLLNSFAVVARARLDPLDDLDLGDRHATPAVSGEGEIRQSVDVIAASSVGVETVPEGSALAPFGERLPLSPELVARGFAPSVGRTTLSVGALAALTATAIRTAVPPIAVGLAVDFDVIIDVHVPDFIGIGVRIAIDVGVRICIGIDVRINVAVSVCFAALARRPAAPVGATFLVALETAGTDTGLALAELANRFTAVGPALLSRTSDQAHQQQQSRDVMGSVHRISLSDK